MKKTSDAEVTYFSHAGHHSITELSSSEDGNNDCDISKANESEVSANTNMSNREVSGIAQKLRSFRMSCGSFVNSNAVQLFVVFLIIVNAITMGVATFDFVEESAKLMRIFELADFIFLLIFTLELALQFIGKGIIGVLSDGWLCFDTIIILASWSLDNFQIARAFRIVRAIRLATRLEALKSLVRALFRVAPSVGAITGFLLLGTRVTLSFF